MNMKIISKASGYCFLPHYCYSKSYHFFTRVSMSFEWSSHFSSREEMHVKPIYRKINFFNKLLITQKTSNVQSEHPLHSLHDSQFLIACVNRKMEGLLLICISYAVAAPSSVSIWLDTINPDHPTAFPYILFSSLFYVKTLYTLLNLMKESPHII